MSISTEHFGNVEKATEIITAQHLRILELEHLLNKRQEMPPPLYTAKDFAEALNVSENIFRRLRREGYLPDAVTLGRSRRWFAEDVRKAVIDLE